MKKITRDNWRIILNAIKNELGVKYETGNKLSSESDCKTALRQIIFKYFIGLSDDETGLKLNLQQFEYVQELERENEELREHGRYLLEENDELRRELKNKKKWWQFWR